MGLQEKHILLGVAGGIAAFKAAALTSKLSKEGAKVKIIMTEAAKHFVGTTTFQALSRNPVYTDTFVEADENKIAHIDLADWADLVLVAPATADTIGKLAHGIADNMLTTTLLATKAPVWIAPAMNVNMYEHPAVQTNLKTLASYGYRIFEPGEGLLACGWVGKGRMPEPEDLMASLEAHFSDQNQREKPLAGKKILVTAGATQEKIDPVRYFTNHSSGKMGYAVAEAASLWGAEVTLVSGPTDITAPKGVQLVSVRSAEEMHDEVMSRYPGMNAVIKAAAVADYRPKITYNEKFKKSEGPLVIEMERTPDILAELGKLKNHQILIGFAAETQNLEENARSKMKRKHLDMVVGNNITEEGSGFRSDTNRVTLFYKDGEKKELPLQSKKAVAEVICKELAELFKVRQSHDC